MQNNTNNLFKAIPSVNKLLETEKGLELNKLYSHEQLMDSIRNTLTDIRNQIKNTKSFSEDIVNINYILELVENKLQKNQKSNLKPCINATGVIVHTNLGRSILSTKAQQAVYDIAGNYSNLEIELDTGKRGSRYSHVISLLKKLSGAEDALVVNNNAAAVLLALNTLAKGQEAIISRGQLVEIGGSFRVPDVMQQGNVLLKEIGCTNKVYISDFENAINENTGLLLQVHTSNYKILGFTEDVQTKELVELGEKHNLPFMYDLGSGVFVDFSKWFKSYEPTVKEIISSGADIVTFSGDKILGGPQAGVIVGKKKYIEQMKKNQLTRALRVDKFTVAALEATLIEYLNPQTVFQNIPTLRMITDPLNIVQNKASMLIEQLETQKNVFEIILKQDYSCVGGGAFPVDKIDTFTVCIKHNKIPAQEISDKLRQTEKPVFTRIDNDFVIFDLRTLTENDINYISNIINSLF